MSKLDDIIRTVALMGDPRSEREAKQEIKDLMLELIGDPQETDSPGRYNCIMEFRQKVKEL